MKTPPFNPAAPNTPKAMDAAKPFEIPETFEVRYAFRLPNGNVEERSLDAAELYLERTPAGRMGWMYSGDVLASRATTTPEGQDLDWATHEIETMDPSQEARMYRFGAALEQAVPSLTRRATADDDGHRFGSQLKPGEYAVSLAEGTVRGDASKAPAAIRSMLAGAANLTRGIGNDRNMIRDLHDGLYG